MNPSPQHDSSPEPSLPSTPRLTRARLVAGTVALVLLGGVGSGVLWHVKARSQHEHRQLAQAESQSTAASQTGQEEKSATDSKAKPDRSQSGLWSSARWDSKQHHGEAAPRSRLSPLEDAREPESAPGREPPPAKGPPPGGQSTRVRVIQVSDKGQQSSPPQEQNEGKPSPPAAPPFPPPGSLPGQNQSGPATEQAPPTPPFPQQGPPSASAVQGQPGTASAQMLPGLESSAAQNAAQQAQLPPPASRQQQQLPAATTRQAPGAWGSPPSATQAPSAGLPGAASEPSAHQHAETPSQTAPKRPGSAASLLEQAAGSGGPPPLGDFPPPAHAAREQQAPGGVSPLPTQEPAAASAAQQAGSQGAFDPFAHPLGSLPGAPQPVPPASQAGQEGSALSGAGGDDSAGGLAPSGPESGPLGTGLPNRQWEGPQTASVEIEKQAPEEIQIGKPAVFVVLVKNTGRVPATDVEVIDLVPKGTRLLQTRPAARVMPGGRVVWQLDVIQPGEQRQVQMEVLPLVEGEVGSVATVRYSAASSARTVATRPELRLQVQAPRKVHVGNEVTLQITISNPGTGPATGVILTEHVPEGLQHPIGNVLEYEVGDLKPKETRQLELTLKAVKPGRVINHLVARGDGQLRDEARNPIEVIAPDLRVAVKGPRFRYLEREATYQITISNPGTAPAKEIELAAQIPPGFKFLEANNYGEFDANTRTVYWSLVELPPGQSGTVTLRLRPEESGQHELLVEAKAQHDLIHRVQHRIKVEGVAALRFEVADIDDPVEVGGETFYEITVVNQGTKAATEIQLVALLPEGLQPIGAQGPVRFRIAGRQVLFDRLPRLSPKAQTTYRIRVRGVRPGDHRIRVQMVSAELRAPVVKEESTRVFGDPEP